MNMNERIKREASRLYKKTWFKRYVKRCLKRLKGDKIWKKK